jgi:hypothetical protein
VSEIVLPQPELLYGNEVKEVLSLPHETLDKMLRNITFLKVFLEDRSL